MVDDSMEAGFNWQLAVEPDLAAEEFIDVLNRSTLGQRRPVDDRPRIAAMLRGADLIVTARRMVSRTLAETSGIQAPGELIGVSRAITDFAYCTYLSDLAVDEACQKQGIGRALIEETHRLAGEQTLFILLAAPAARTYYPHIGMQHHDSCWLRRVT